MSFVEENKNNKNFSDFVFQAYNLSMKLPKSFKYLPDFEDYDSEIFPEEGTEVTLLYSDTQDWAEDGNACGSIYILLFHVPSLDEYFGARCTYDSWGGEIEATCTEVIEVLPNVYAPPGARVTPVVIGI